MTKTPASAAYYAGYRAYEKGVLLKLNPYPPNTLQHTEWSQGWHEAKIIYTTGH